MDVGGVGIRSGSMVQSLADMRDQLADLQRQLSTGKKADTYAGIGLDRGLTVGLRSHLATISGYNDTISNVGVRIDLVQSGLSRVASIAHDLKAGTSQDGFDADASGQTNLQKQAGANLGEILGLLNTRAGDRYVFSGRAVDKPAVETMQHILDGDGARAGLRQLISERNQADLGASGLGRVVVSAPSSTSVALTEDAAGSPFGFKVGAISSTTGATLSGPSGVPPGIAIDFGATNPTAGQTVAFNLRLPDGSSESLTLTATNAATPGKNEFTVGATPAATAANLQAALTTSLGTLARTSLSAASALAASNDFFNMDSANPPKRVAGPPFDTATALVAGTPSNTVSWYTGEAGTDPARGTTGAMVDETIGVSYGTRANEQGIRWVVQNVAALAATSFSPSDPDSLARYAALKSRLTPALDTPSGVQSIESIQADLAGAQSTLAAAKNRHQQTSSTLSGLLDQVEGATPEEVGAKILALQTRLQASMQTTAMLYQLSMVNYLK